MATINASSPLTVARSSLEGTLAGTVFTYTGAAAIGDVINMGVFPEGTHVDELALSSDTANAGMTVSVGWAYVDGSASAAAEFIATGTALATASLIRANTTGARTVLAGDAYLTITIAGAAMAAGTTLRARSMSSNRGTR